MERVMFLVEATGDRVPCLLNPESIVARRRAGVRARPVPIGAAVADEPLACDGGGASEWQLDLLFDVDLAGEAVVDVRQLTAPLARLAENAWDDQRPRAPRVRLIWGKRWNLPGVIASLAERYEYFTAGGTPRRSWMRLRLLRDATPGEDTIGLPAPDPLLVDALADGERAPDDEVGAHRVIGDAGIGERLDVIAERHYGDPSYWRVIAAYNDISDPFALVDGRVIELPSPAWLEGQLTRTRHAASTASRTLPIASTTAAGTTGASVSATAVGAAP